MLTFIFFNPPWDSGTEWMKTGHYFQKVADSPLECSPDGKPHSFNLLLISCLRSEHCQGKTSKGPKDGTPWGLPVGLAIAPSGIKKCNIPSGTIHVFVIVIFRSALLNIQVDKKQSSYLNTVMIMRIRLYWSPSTEEWIKKMWYIYTMEYYSAIKRNKIGSFVETWMDPPSGYQVGRGWVGWIGRQGLTYIHYWYYV